MPFTFNLSAREYFVRFFAEVGDKRYTFVHVFRMATPEDWYNYFRSSSQVGLSKGKDTVEFTGESQERDTELWNSMIVRVEGYKKNGVDVMTLPDWKNEIPIPHKLNAIAVGPFYFFRLPGTIDGSVEESTGFDLGSTEFDIKFETGQNAQSIPLTFTFKTPEQTDYIKYSRIMARMQLVRTKQRGVSAIRVPASLQPLIDLFDKLIVKVSGYVYDGKDIMELPEWKSKVDLYHKREAVREVFGATSSEEEEKNL